MSINLKKTTNVETRVEISLVKAEIIEFLVEKGVIDHDVTDVNVFFYVPGGGDWSYTAIDIDEDNPISVTYKTVETTES